MISHLFSTPIYVSDQDSAVDFYVNKLGFELRADEPMGPSARWIMVAPKGAQTCLTLYKPTPEMPGAETYEAATARIGRFTGAIFDTPDIQATYRELSARGVPFAEPPAQQPWGWWATFSDPDGNSFGLGQH
ncbi:MAG TPA: VOC family protein [Chloroflexota bacterium]|nr:VOC family protein [Chloroflexota bacterium]